MAEPEGDNATLVNKMGAVNVPNGQGATPISAAPEKAGDSHRGWTISKGIGDTEG